MKYELIKYCEFDKYAQKSYDAIHGTTQEDNLGDVCEADFTLLKQETIIKLSRSIYNSILSLENDIIEEENEYFNHAGNK